MSSVVTQDQAAELAGVTARRMRQLAKTGEGPPQDANGQYPCHEFGEWLKRRHLSGLVMGQDGETYNLEAERARLAKEQADRTAMENEERRGRLVDAERVGAWWYRLITDAKQRLLALPTKAAPLVIGRSMVEARDLLQDMLTQILNDLASADPLGDPIGEQGMEAAAEADRQPVGGSKTKAKPRKQRRAGGVED